jgi:hypothetical protein
MTDEFVYVPFNPEEELPQEDDGDLFSLNAMFSMASGDA